MAQPVDPNSFDPVGEPFTVGEQVGTFRNRSYVSVSASGALAFRSVTRSGTQLVWFDRQGRPMGDAGPPGAYNYVSLSPDGKRAAVSQRQTDAIQNIWLLDVARGIPTRFTFEPTIDYDSVWSPDGSRLAFASDKNARNTWDVFVKDSSGSGSESPLLTSGVTKRRATGLPMAGICCTPRSTRKRERICGCYPTRRERWPSASRYPTSKPLPTRSKGSSLQTAIGSPIARTNPAIMKSTCNHSPSGPASFRSRPGGASSSRPDSVTPWLRMGSVS
jgi:dipeptidyl aminopeptidase/acylaminoacyl peptidase